MSPGSKLARAHRLDHEHSERPLRRPSIFTVMRPDAVRRPRKLRLLEALLAVPVRDHHRRPAQQRVAGLRSLAAGYRI